MWLTELECDSDSVSHFEVRNHFYQLLPSNTPIHQKLWSSYFKACIRIKGFPGGAVVKNSPAGDMVRSLSWEDPLE